MTCRKCVRCEPSADQPFLSCRRSSFYTARGYHRGGLHGRHTAHTRVALSDAVAAPLGASSTRQPSTCADGTGQALRSASTGRPSSRLADEKSRFPAAPGLLWEGIKCPAQLPGGSRELEPRATPPVTRSMRTQIPPEGSRGCVPGNGASCPGTTDAHRIHVASR